MDDIYIFFFFVDFFSERKEKRGRAFTKRRRRSTAFDGGGTGTPNILLTMNNDNIMAHGSHGIIEWHNKTCRVV